jgi:hypothetical protein
MRTSFVHFSVAILSLAGVFAAAAAGSACSDASGQLFGGESLTQAAVNEPVDANVNATSACPAGGGMTGWQDLYACYFHTCGLPACHSSLSDEGAAFSGFVCGADAATCFAGITSSSNSSPPIVPSGGATDATTTLLWAALNKGGNQGNTDNNMPLMVPPFVFGAGDLTSIRAWIQAGAQNN